MFVYCCLRKGFLRCSGLFLDAVILEIVNSSWFCLWRVLQFSFLFMKGKTLKSNGINVKSSYTEKKGTSWLTFNQHKQAVVSIGWGSGFIVWKIRNFQLPIVECPRKDCRKKISVCNFLYCGCSLQTSPT